MSATRRVLRRAGVHGRQRPQGVGGDLPGGRERPACRWHSAGFALSSRAALPRSSEAKCPCQRTTASLVSAFTG